MGLRLNQGSPVAECRAHEWAGGVLQPAFLCR
jgi:hypothetical protein